jgi:histidinol dehydrogenase
MRRISLDEALARGPAAAADPGDEVRRRVGEIVADVRARGDAALDEWRGRLDPGAPPALEVPRDACDKALASISGPVRAALEGMAARVAVFARRQRAQLVDFEVETEPGVLCGQRVRPVERAGCYVPAGRYPLPSTAIMTALVAREAGVGEVAIACPRPAPVVLAAAAIARADRVFAMGGAHAVAALAFGTARVPRVDLVCGPGGVYVAEAKRQLAGVVGVDLPAGPSEVLVLADASARADLVIADLLAQAEHDPAARPLLGTTSEEIAAAVEAHVARGFAGAPNGAVLTASCATQGRICVVADRAGLARLADATAPEHLALHVERPAELLARISHFGAAFLGEEAGEVFGDYGAGPNHTLPTAGAARFAGGLSVATFLRLQTTLRLTAPAAARLADATATLAEAEGLAAHAWAALLRKKVASEKKG